MAFLQIEDTNVWKNHLTQEQIILFQGEFRPYKTEYTRRMHELCVTLNEQIKD